MRKSKTLIIKFGLALASTFALCTNAFPQQSASVFITAGQSNADGRVYNNQLPQYLKSGYKYLHFKNVTSSSNGTFGTRQFISIQEGGRFAFCDVVNYYIEQALMTDFYSIKCAYGGTAIDTAATYEHLPVWCADATWIEGANAYRGDITTGKSLTKSMTEGFGDCVDTTLSKLEQGYDVKAIMWHQGESDRSKAGNYYKNFTDMINYMRSAIFAKTGNEKDKTLPFIFGTVSHNSKQFNSVVEAAQIQAAKDLPNVYYIDMKDASLRSDALHFDSLWTDYLGKMMYNKLVELNLVKGQVLDVEKPHVPTASDTLQVAAERKWDFTQPWAQTTVDSIVADVAHWPMFQSLGYRYTSSISQYKELSTANGFVFPETKGLYFKCGSGNRMIVKPGDDICLYADNLYMMVPKVSPGQLVTIVTASAKGERGLTTDSNDELELVSGGVKSSNKTTNVWRVKDTLKEPVDLVFHSNGGAIYVYSVEVSSPYQQILVGADGAATFSSDKSCCVKEFSELIKAYIPTSYDAASKTISLSQIDTIPANTGALIIGEECLVGAPEVETSTSYPDNLLVAVTGKADVNATEIVDGVLYNNYNLRAVNGETAFHKMTATGSMYSEAYLRLPSVTSTTADVVTYGEKLSTAISSAKLKNMEKGIWYTINGIAVTAPSKGLYVFNGKKYLIE